MTENFRVKSPSENDATPESSEIPESNCEECAEPRRIVGVGASAGGLEALEKFFENVPEDTGFGFVVIQHLSPDYESRMDELLGRKTKMLVRIAQNEMDVEPNAVYVLPPKREMIISGGKLLLTEKDEREVVNLPIDHFLRSLAQDIGACAIAVILSGTGSDGSRGIRSVAEHDGFVLAQEPSTARFDGMPVSAQETGVVDLSLPPEKMIDAILKHVEAEDEKDCDPMDDEDPEGRRSAEKAKAEFEEIFNILRVEHGIDFQHYKPTTVMRRVERRIALADTDLEHYVDQLRTDPDELVSLYRDLLIGVTKFFRDPQAFEALGSRQVMDSLFENCREDGEVRVWVAGCATGEEAYSLGVLLDHERRQRGLTCKVKIFATDVHRSSLEIAGRGIYPTEALSEVRESWRSDYFEEVGEDQMKVIARLREMVVFAHHNVIKSAPFTRLDLVTCRNLLIYFRPPAQRKALSLFHFGLKTGGILFLGASETPGDIIDEFQAIDTHWKIYRKRRDVRLAGDTRSLLPEVVVSQATSKGWSRQLRENDLLKVYDDLLNRFIPAGVLVDDRYNLLHTFGDADQLLRMNRGRPSQSLIDLLDENLKGTVGGALQHVSRKGASVVYTGLPCVFDGEERRLDLHVAPINKDTTRGQHYLLLFREPEESERDENGQPEVRSLPQSEVVDLSTLTRDHISGLEQELNYTKENLQATIEELETSNEELQATNEEMVASNEELQSSNEELHSVNEELQTVNSEHQRKITELGEMTNDMENLLASTEMGVIFLDKNLEVRKFTPKVGDFFQLMPQDIGRSIEHFSHSLIDVDIAGDARKVLEEGNIIETETRDGKGHVYLRRVLPYRARTEIAGVLLTFVDITEISRTRLERDRLSEIVEHSPDYIYTADRHFRSFYVNPAAREILDIPEDGRLKDINVADWHNEKGFAKLVEEARGLRPGESVRFENQLGNSNGKPVPVDKVVIAHADETAEDQVAFYSSVARDLRKEVHNKNRLKILNRTLTDIVRKQPGIVFVFDDECEIQYASDVGEELLRRLNEEGELELPDELADKVRGVLTLGKASKGTGISDSVTVEIGGDVHYFIPRLVPLNVDDDEQANGVILTLEDVTEFHDSDIEKTDLIGAVSHELKNPITAIQLPLMMMLEGKFDNDPSRYRQLLSSMNDEVTRMYRTVTGLLDVARFNNQDGNLTREEIGTTDLLESVMNASRAQSGSSDVDLKLEIDTTYDTLSVDIARLTTAILNLVNNAIKHSPDDSTVDVMVADDPDYENHIMISVTDEGIGIPRKHQNRIFERFYKISTHSKPGSGLGLSIARTFVEAHSGDIGVESEPGHTRFWIRLPIRASAARRDGNGE